MTKRYAFFREPTGKIYSGNDGKYAPTALLAEIGKSSVPSGEGQVGWSNFVLLKMEPALRASVALIGPDDRELNESDAKDILLRAIVESVKKSPGQPVMPTKLLMEADRIAAAHFRQSESPYILISSLSVNALPAKTIRVGGCVVASLAKRGTRFPLPDVLSQPGQGAAFTEHLNSSRYHMVKVASLGRTLHEATNNALDALNLLRGLWSLFATRGSWSMTLGGSTNTRKPLGVIHTGPIHTLHTPDGRLVENLFWYDPDFSGDRPIFTGDAEWARIEKSRRAAMKRLTAHHYRHELEALLIRYAIALDQPNPSLAFLQMWSLLEKITNTVGAKYDETIRRAVWVYSKNSRSIAKDVLESLRYLRNQYVHSGRAGDHCDGVAYLLKDFVEPHLIRLISNPFKVRSLEEYGELLTLPTDLATLEERRRKMQRAIRMMKAEKRT
jgi:hypothetical protein